MFRNLHRNLKVRIFEIFIVSILNNMLYPFLAIYFAQKFGAALAGIMMVFNILVGAIAGFYGGHLGDKIGRRKTMLISEQIRLFAFVIAILANSPWFEWPWVTFAVMTVNSICWGLAAPALEAMVIDVSTPENRKFVYTVQYWGVNVGMVVGSLLGGFLFLSHRFEIYISVTVGSVLSVILLLFFIKETFTPSQQVLQNEPSKGQFHEILGNYKIVFKDLKFIMFVLASLLIYSIELQARNYSGVRLMEEFGNQTILSIHNWNFIANGVQMFGLLTAENAFLVVVIALFIGRLIKKYTDRSVLYSGILFFALGYAIIGFSNSPFLLIFVMFVATIGELMWVPVQQSIMAGLPPESNRSSYMAVNGMVLHGTNILGSLAITIGAYIPSWTMAIIIFGTGLLSIVLCEKSVRSLKYAKTINHSISENG